MPKLKKTSHAKRRIQQRGFHGDDIEIVLQAATQVAPDAYMLRDADVEREISKHKRVIQQLERLSGTKLIIESGRLIIQDDHACSSHHIPFANLVGVWELIN